MKMMPDIMNLGMAVMATGNTVIGASGDDLIELHLAIGPAFFGIPCLQKATTTAATVIV